MQTSEHHTLANIPKLGAGIGFRDQLKAELFLNREKVDWLEITADHFMDASPEKERELELLIEHFTLIPHGLNLSLGSAEGIDPIYMRKFAKIIEKINPPYWSDHIAFTHAGGIEIGHLSPMPFTNEALDVLTKNIESAREFIDLPLILENITYIVEMPSEMSEAQFLRRLVERTECGLLLDVTNLYTNAVNHGYDLDAFLAEAPLESVVQLHFTGGEWAGGLLIDSHSTATPEEVWELLDKVVAKAPVRGVLLERDEKIPPFAELEPELARARQIGQALRTMGLAEFQIALARLFTDADFRRSISEDSDTLSKIVGLTDSEKTQLVDLISRDSRLNQFANSLAAKRRGEVAKIASITVRILGPDFRKTFESYVSTKPQFEGPKKHLRDSYAFAQFVQQDKNLNDRDTVRFEADCLGMRLKPKIFYIGVYRWSEQFRQRSGRKVRFVVAVWWLTKGRELRMRIFQI